MKKPKFKRKYTLGEGHPWAYGIGPYYEIGMNEYPVGIRRKELEWPKELWSKECPKYRLVLERVK